MTLARVSLLLPIAASLVTWAAVTRHRRTLGLTRLSARGTLVVAFLLVQAVVLAISELASVGRHLTFGAVAAAWGLVTAAGAWVVLRKGGTSILEDQARGAVARLRRSGVLVWLGAGALVAIGLVLVLLAWLYLPNNADSLAYHLPRVAHWIQNQSIAHFATHYTSQIELAPLHELNMLHLHLLADTDRLDGYVQLVGWMVAVLAASEIARLLGARREVQVLAAVIAATLPNALLEATSTQNNLFAATVGLALVVVMLGWEPLGPTAAPGALLGLGAGLAVMSKGTVVPLLAPAIVALGTRAALAESRRSSWREVGTRLLQVAAAATVVAAVVVGPFVQRNHDLFGTFAGSATGTTIDEPSPRGALVNGVRNVAVHFRIGDGGDGLRATTSRVALGALERLYDWSNPPSDPVELDLYRSQDAFEQRDYTEFEHNEDYGASPWHLVLYLLAVPVLLVLAVRRDGTERTAALLAVALVAGFLVYSGTVLFTLYGARYQLPVLLALAPVAAVALASVHRWALRAVGVLLIAASLPVTIDSWARPLFDRPTATNDLDAYFVARPEGDPDYPASSAYVEVRDAIVASGCDRVAVGSWVLFEYPLWVGLEHLGWDGEIRHVDVGNPSRALAVPGFEPCAIVRARLFNPPQGPIPGWIESDHDGLLLALDPAVAAAGEP